MKISIITAVFNRKKTIIDTVKSIKYQEISPHNLEHIVIDGGSTDGTLEILRSSLDDNTVFISEPDNGIYDALNKGLQLATGDIIGILHSDDFFEDNFVLNDVLCIFIDPEIDIVYGDINYISNKDVNKLVRHWISGLYEKKKLRWGWMPPHPTFFFRRDLFIKLGGYNIKYRISADYDFMLRCLLYKKIKVNYIPRVLVNMRVGGESNSSINNIYKKICEDYVIIKINNIGGFLTLFYKNISKIKQIKIKNFIDLFLR